MTFFVSGSSVIRSARFLDLAAIFEMFEIRLLHQSKLNRVGLYLHHKNVVVEVEDLRSSTVPRGKAPIYKVGLVWVLPIAKRADTWARCTWDKGQIEASATAPICPLSQVYRAHG